MLKKQIIDKIRTSGGIGVDELIELCNTHYYSTRDPLGAKGDFITAPEISQIFGEIIGVWAITQWELLKRPEKIAIMELGAGRGTLMADLLRAIKIAPDFNPEIHIVEISPVLRNKQKEALKKYNVTWHNSPKQLDIPTIIIANEFFDALPIKQFCGLEERRMLEKDGKLYFSHNEVTLETCEIAKNIISDITLWAAAGVIIDYGYFTPSTGDSLQAMKTHKYTNPLENLGDSDITSHVNFAELAAACLKKPKLMTQREFLLAYGADIRAKILGKEQDLQRLIAPEQMGELFKVLCF